MISMISLNNIGVTFSPHTATQKKALKGLSLEVQAGEFVTVIGSNGAGKSTFLNLVAGEIQPDAGRVQIAGQDMTGLSCPERSHLIARVFQDPLAGTCGDLTIEENMALAYSRGRTRGLKSAIPRDLRSEFARELKVLGLGLETRMNSLVKLLSGGQRQALSLLMATLAPLQVLLLDEHTAALDPKTADFVLRITEKITQEKKITVLMVTHSLSQAIEMGTRTLMFHEGKVIHDISGEVRARTTVSDLLTTFGKSMDSDRALLA
jgi:putative ABC transport system ATP-binding protein